MDAEHSYTSLVYSKHPDQRLREFHILHRFIIIIIIFLRWNFLLCVQYILTLPLSVLLATCGMFSISLSLYDTSWADVPFPTPSSLEVTNSYLSDV